MSDIEYSVIKNDVIKRFDCFYIFFLSTHNICFVLEIRKVIFKYALVSGGLCNNMWRLICTVDVLKKHKNTPTKWSDAQPLVEQEKQFECLPVEIPRSQTGKEMLYVWYN